MLDSHPTEVLDISAGRRAAAPGGERPVHIVGIGGTTRIGSSSEMALRFCLRAAQAMGATSDLLTGPLLDLPMYDPSSEHRSPGALRLVEALRRADGVIISTPCYHGGMSGMMKNALDYLEDMRSDPRVYLDGRGVGIIVSAYGAQALGTTLVSVRATVHALRGWPTPFAAALNSAEKPFKDGQPSDEITASQLTTVAEQVVRFARMQRQFAQDQRRELEAGAERPRMALGR